MVLVAAIIAARRWLPEAAGWLAPAGVAVAAVLALAAPGVLPDAAPASADAELDGTVAWQAFDRSAISTLVAAGKVVFVDVTADWCITCQVNKRRVLRTAEVDTLLAGDGVVAMRADWTRPSDAIARYLASFGRFGIPFNVVYGPDAPRGVVLPELLTHSAVIRAVGTAGRTALAAR